MAPAGLAEVRAGRSDYEQEREAGWPERGRLLEELAAAGLIAEQLDPIRCQGDVEYLIRLLMPDGSVWAEASHESAESVRAAIRNFSRRL